MLLLRHFFSYVPLLITCCIYLGSTAIKAGARSEGKFSITIHYNKDGVTIEPIDPKLVPSQDVKLTKSS
jgi:hypothetical protein